MATDEQATSEQPAPEDLFRPPVDAAPKRAWLPMVVGAGIVTVALVAGVLIWRVVQGPEPQGPPSYASQLKISDLKVSQAQNFVGGTVTYLEGNIQNAGDKTVTSVSVNALFHNTLDEVVQKEILPVRVLDRSGPYPDTFDMRMRPLAPGQQREFRLTLERISADWNQQYPDLRIVGVSLQ